MANDGALSIHIPFHKSTAYERALFGAFGSGKTYAAVDEGIAWLLEQPGIRGLFSRKTVPELRDTLEPIFLERCPHDLLTASTVRKTGGHIESITFPNGSVALFRSLDDWNKHRSLNLGFLVIDEANEIDEETYQGMLSRIRQKDLTEEARQRGYTGQITRRGVWLATNPNGHDWLYYRFIDDKQRHVKTDYFKSTSLDNPHLPPEYIDSLLQFPEPWIKRYVLCSFDDFAGQIYEDWNEEDHFIEPYVPDPNSIFWMGFDPGTRHNNAAIWVHVNAEKRELVVVDEYLSGNMAASAHAKEWRRIEAKHKMKNVAWRVADPNVNTRDRGSNMRLSDMYRREGFHFNLGPRRYDDRIPMLGQLIYQKRFKVMRSCPMTFEQIRDYRWEDITPAQRAKGVDPPEKPLKKNEHLVDCSQYVSSRWTRPLHPVVIRPDLTFDQELRKAIRKDQRRKRAKFGSSDLGMAM